MFLGKKWIFDNKYRKNKLNHANEIKIKLKYLNKIKLKWWVPF